MGTAEIHTIDSAYMIEFEHVPGGFRVKDLSGDTAPHTYTPPYCAHLYYYTRYGVWRRTTGDGKWEFDSDDKGRNYRPAIIRDECGIPRRHYDALIVDDMPVRGSKTTAEGLKKAVDWYEKAKRDDMIDAAIYGVSMETAKRRRQGIITNITEGGNEMRRLYHVILFNKKTENIDFKEYIVAGDETDASMQAAQAYGKYSSATHVTIVKYIEGSDYEVIK